MKIVIDIDIPYIRGVLEPFSEVVYLKGDTISCGDIADADAMIIRTRTRCNEALLSDSRVKIIASATIGFDHIDTSYCRANGIKVTTAAGSNARGVLQWVGAGLVFAGRRQGWKPEDRTIGVVGIGHVGRLVAQYAKGWGFRVVCCDPPRKRANETAPDGTKFISLDQIIDQADIITLHTPLTRSGKDATFHMVDFDFFARLRKGTILINSSRGEVVDTDALVGAVRDGRCDAIIDTWEGEPDISGDLLASAMLATPHIAGYSIQGKANATSMAVGEVAKCLNLPLNGWYPEQVSPTMSNAAREISWGELNDTIENYFDIVAQTEILKSLPQKFESLRNDYNYREEYF